MTLTKQEIWLFIFVFLVTVSALIATIISIIWHKVPDPRDDLAAEPFTSTTNNKNHQNDL